jgi:hypothetical protein
VGGCCCGSMGVVVRWLIDVRELGAAAMCGVFWMALSRLSVHGVRSAMYCVLIALDTACSMWFAAPIADCARVCSAPIRCVSAVSRLTLSLTKSTTLSSYSPHPSGASRLAEAHRLCAQLAVRWWPPWPQQAQDGRQRWQEEGR